MTNLVLVVSHEGDLYASVPDLIEALNAQADTYTGQAPHQGPHLLTAAQALTTFAHQLGEMATETIIRVPDDPSPLTPHLYPWWRRAWNRLTQ